MLSEIRIEALGAISVATAEFDRGLTVLTGETGTGKTMVVTGLHLLGGARADANRVRSGAERAVVEGRFTTGDLDQKAAAQIDEMLDALREPSAMRTAASSRCARSAATVLRGPTSAGAACRPNR